jgi:transcriptional regulator with XRE-family HTH domain
LPTPRLRDRTQIAAEIARLRSASGLTLKEFAAKAGKPGQGPQFGRYERNETPPSLETLEQIAAAAGVSVDVFYAETKSPLQPITAGEAAELLGELREIERAVARALLVVERAVVPTAPAALDPIDELDAELDHPPPGLAPREAERRRRAG